VLPVLGNLEAEGLGQVRDRLVMTTMSLISIAKGIPGRRHNKMNAGGGASRKKALSSVKGEAYWSNSSWLPLWLPLHSRYPAGLIATYTDVDGKKRAKD